MTSLSRLPWCRPLARAAGLGALFALATSPMTAIASPAIIYDYIPGAPLPRAQAPVRQVPRNQGPRQNPTLPDRYAYGTPTPFDPAQQQALQANRCNIGRLVGGIVGGGLGYATSRQDGRSWAVPLGALLGQQVGCSIGAGRGPRPW